MDRAIASRSSRPVENAGPGRNADQGGFSLVEVLVAALVAVIAVLGLAHSFGTGRGLIDRFAAAREALAVAEERLEVLAALAARDPGAPELRAGVHGPFPRPLSRSRNGSESWTVVWVDDPVDDGGGDANPDDYKRVTVEILWWDGSTRDRVALSRLYPSP